MHAAAHHDRRALKVKAQVAEITRPAHPTRTQLDVLEQYADRDIYVETITATGINPDGTSCAWCGDLTHQAADQDGLAYCDATCLDGHVDTWLANQPPPGWIADLTDTDHDRAEAAS